jgi:hypothetical protein
MSREAHVDNPGEVRWFPGYGPASVLGRCEHNCTHLDQATVAWGPDPARYELVRCVTATDAESLCAGRCRAWSNSLGRIVTPWLTVDVPVLTVGG